MDNHFSDYNYRFNGIQRLVGNTGLAKLHRARVCIVGIGGVGSWAVEALARSGIGHLTLVDWDDICISNVNRQIHALNGTLGQTKIEVMKKRIHLINPECQVETHHEYFAEKTAGIIFAKPYDFVIDAIDSMNAKCFLLYFCREREIPIVTVGGAGGRIDPTSIRIDDLSRSYKDPLLADVRKKLRYTYGFPKDTQVRFGIECVFSPAAIVYPHADGSVCAHPPESDSRLHLDCELGYGTASFFTGTFGFAAASCVVKRIVTVD